MSSSVEVLSLLITTPTTIALSDKIVQHEEREKDLVLYFGNLRTALSNQQEQLLQASEVWAGRSVDYQCYRYGFYLGFDAITTQLPNINSLHRITYQNLVESGFNGDIKRLLLRSLQGRISYSPRVVNRPVNPGQTEQAFLSYLIDDSPDFCRLFNRLGDRLNTMQTTAFVSGLKDVMIVYIGKIRDMPDYQGYIKRRRLI